MVSVYPYRRIFVDEYGDGPWACYVCGEDVVDLLVHHLDENRQNDAVSNLVAIHRSCHMHLHQKGKPKTAEHRARLSSAGQRRVFSAETREKMSMAKRGKPQSKLNSQRRGDSLRGRQLSDEHKRNISISRRKKTPE